METFGGNFKQRQSFLLYTHNFFGVFSKSYTDFVILNYKELANFEITLGYPLPITVESPNFVLSIVERYLIQCPLFGESIKRDSTVGIFPHIILFC